MWRRAYCRAKAPDPSSNVDGRPPRGSKSGPEPKRCSRRTWPCGVNQGRPQAWITVMAVAVSSTVRCSRSTRTAEGSCATGSPSRHWRSVPSAQSGSSPSPGVVPTRSLKSRSTRCTASAPNTPALRHLRRANPSGPDDPAAPSSDWVRRARRRSRHASTSSARDIEASEA
ncbi:hypothetical protein STPH1_0836 [Streptomyces sp. OM5714]|nr:hypothetical protein STPH1_0836 [Streptomyces sp. OM5714]